MANSNLRLIKPEKSNSKWGAPPAQPALRPPIPFITPAEAAEMYRFKSLTMTRAARQVKLGQITSRVQGMNEFPPAA